MLRQEYPDISLATVYRNLKQLSEGGEIRKLEVPGGADRYDHRTISHYHARCLRCGRLFDVEMDYIEHLERSIKDTHGFVISGHDIMFKGVCPKCIAQAAPPASPQAGASFPAENRG